MSRSIAALDFLVRIQTRVLQLHILSHDCRQPGKLQYVTGHKQEGVEQLFLFARFPTSREHYDKNRDDAESGEDEIDYVEGRLPELLEHL